MYSPGYRPTDQHNMIIDSKWIPQDILIHPVHFEQVTSSMKQYYIWITFSKNMSVYRFLHMTTYLWEIPWILCTNMYIFIYILIILVSNNKFYISVQVFQHNNERTSRDKGTLSTDEPNIWNWKKCSLFCIIWNIWHHVFLFD